MNILKPERKLAILSALLEGCSVRSTSRMTGSHIETILKLLVETGQKCHQILDERLRGLHCQALEIDELWTFVYKKQRRLTKQELIRGSEHGDTYTYVALDPDTKLVCSYLVGKRDMSHTYRFMADLSRRIEGTVQFSTDGFKPYIDAISRHFGNRATHAQIIKMYRADFAGSGRYAPPKVTGVEVYEVLGMPDHERICTSYVERNNWTIRCQMRRFTRLANGFSRKLENLRAAVALWFCYYNFCRVHGSLRVTPAMAAGVTDRMWALPDLL